MSVTIFPCLDEAHRYVPNLCASCTLTTCWTGLPVRGGSLNQLAIPPRLPCSQLPRYSELGSSCQCWHWQAPVTEYELAYGRVAVKAGAAAPCPDFVPLQELRPAVTRRRAYDADRLRRHRGVNLQITVHLARVAGGYWQATIDEAPDPSGQTPGVRGAVIRARTLPLLLREPGRRDSGRVRRVLVRCRDCGKPLPGLPGLVRCLSCQARREADGRYTELWAELARGGADMRRLELLRNAGQQLEELA
ncbi:MAG TPA: hypothetical protein VMW62_09135 [Chloroflexota bacterium]|nr:hypothetical protein [Chloroflexota bacterium]